MNIVIAGDGEVGFHLAKLLAGDHHNITIVDPHEELLKMIESHTDLLAVTGDSTSIEVLESANIRKTDLLISVLHDEQINIVTCILGKKLGAKRTIARIKNVEYLCNGNPKMFESLGIDAMVCPERIAAEELVKLLQQPAATEIFDFSGSKLMLFLVRLDEKSQVLNKTLNDIAHERPNLDFRAVAIHRNGKTIVPQGSDQFLLNDLIYVVTKPSGIEELFRMGGKEKHKIRDVMIIGGGRIGRETARRLENNFNVKLIEIDKERCVFLSDMLSNTLIINGDARDTQLLETEGIRSMDAFIAVTDDTEANMFSCLLAKRLGVKRVIPLVENIDYIDISQSIGIESIINKKLITASYIVQYTMEAKVTAIKCLSGIDAEVLEFEVQSNAKITKGTISKIKTPPGSLIGGIIRGEESFIATGDFQIQEGDKVVVFAVPDAIYKVSTLFH
jgi:trk system potassium uptake protein